MVGALAAHRLTRLAVQDVITAPLREKLFDRWPPSSDSPTYALVCTWCASVWAGLTVAGLQGKGGKLGRGLVYALALADAVGIAEERL